MFTKPPGIAHIPSYGQERRLTSSTCRSRCRRLIITTSTVTDGRSNLEASYLFPNFSMLFLFNLEVCSKTFNFAHYTLMNKLLVAVNLLFQYHTYAILLGKANICSHLGGKNTTWEMQD